MPPSFKASREEIIAAALELAREKGLSGITARAVGNKLKLSSRPVYSFFPSIDVLKENVVSEIAALYESCMRQPRTEDPFLNVGLGQVIFARMEPVFYQIMQESYDKTSFMEDIFREMKKQEKYDTFPESELMDVYLKISLFTNGLAESVMRNQLVDDSEENLRRLLFETGDALFQMKYRTLMDIKGDDK